MDEGEVMDEGTVMHKGDRDRGVVVDRDRGKEVPKDVQQPHQQKLFQCMLQTAHLRSLLNSVLCERQDPRFLMVVLLLS